MSELKACPFCGGKVEPEDMGGAIVICCPCDLTPCTVRATTEVVAESWNIRALGPALDVVAEHLPAAELRTLSQMTNPPRPIGMGVLIDERLVALVDNECALGPALDTVIEAVEALDDADVLDEGAEAYAEAKEAKKREKADLYRRHGARMPLGADQVCPADWLQPVTLAVLKSLRGTARTEGARMKTSKEGIEAMPTEKQIEAAAREMFYLSYGAQMGLWHWPGDTPKLVRHRWDADQIMAQTTPADHQSAPSGGKKPDELRAMARRILEAAETAK